MILIVGIMLFGRRLPEVGRTVGKTIVQMRQGLNKLKVEMNMEAELSELKSSVTEVRDEIDRTVEAPRRVLRDPGDVLLNLTDEGLASARPKSAKSDATAEVEDDARTSPND